MGSYVHRFFIIDNFCEYTFDSSFNDNVYTKIGFRLLTIDQDHPRRYQSTHYLDLAPPTQETFIPFKDVGLDVLKSWISKGVDMISIQNDNIAVVEQLPI